MGLSASSGQKDPAAAKTSETGSQKEDETRSHREHVCSGSYLAGTEHARSSGTRSTRLYQEMRRGGAGQRHSGTLCRPAHFARYSLHTICCLTASLTQEQPRMCDKLQQQHPTNVPYNTEPIDSAFGVTESSPPVKWEKEKSLIVALALLRCSTRARLHTWEMRHLTSSFLYMNLMSTPRNHIRISTVISSSNIDFQGSVPKVMLLSLLMTSDLERHWLARLLC